jgi:hypothetical protein
MRYEVTYGYRTDGGLDYSMSTHFDSVFIEAPDEATARQSAIDAAYQKGHITHITIRSVVPQLGS